MEKISKKGDKKKVKKIESRAHYARSLHGASLEITDKKFQNI